MQQCLAITYGEDGIKSKANLPMFERSSFNEKDVHPLSSDVQEEPS